MSKSIDLIEAAGKGNTDIVQQCLESGADINAANAYGVTPLIAAIFAGHYTMTELLINRGAKVNQANDHTGRNPLMTAASMGHCAIAELLIDKGESPNETNRYNGKTPLMYAAKYSKNTEIVSQLITHGATIDKLSRRGKTALMLALQRSNYGAADLLIGNGADINQPNLVDGNTALMSAIKWNYEQVQYLLDRGADANQINPVNGKTPLMISADAIWHRSSSIAKLLIKHGASVNQINQNTGETALMVAINNSSIEYEHNPTAIATHKANRRAIIRTLLKHGTEINQSNAKNGVTALMLAASKNDPCITLLLLLLGAAPNLQDINGQTALHHAVHQLFPTTMPVLSLIAFGADPKIRDYDNKTPADLACPVFFEMLRILALSEYEAFQVLRATKDYEAERQEFIKILHQANVVSALRAREVGYKQLPLRKRLHEKHASYTQAAGAAAAPIE